MRKFEKNDNNKRENAATAVRTAARNVVETLESRQLMSVTWSSGNLTVNGTNNPDTIVVDTMPFVSGMCLVSVTENNVVTQPFVPMLLSKKITVNGKGGADNIQCQKVEEMPVTVDGGGGNDTIQGGSKNDTLKGGDNEDTIYGRDGNDTLDGGNHNDTLIGGWGADKFVGGGGTGDTVDYSNRNDSLIITINGVADDGMILEMDNIGLDVENLIGGDGNDFITGDGDANKLQGGEGNDLIYGNGAGDTIYGGTVSDVSIAGDDPQERDTIFGGDGVDSLYAPVNGHAVIHGGNQGDKIFGSYGRDQLHGDDGDDTIEGGWADDLLWGGKGDDTLKGGKGDDTLVTIGGGNKDQLYGNDGFDTFWLDPTGFPYVEEVYDPSVEEISAGHLHRVESFHPIHYRSHNYEQLPPDQIQFVDTELDGENIADPLQVGGGGQWKDFSDHPLFPDQVGPLPSDVRQGQVGDCYFGVGLSGIARENPDRIKQSVVDLGDGTYAVEFHTSFGTDFYRVDGDLPVDGNGKLKYLETGKDGAIWVAILEKAFTFARENDDIDYALHGSYKFLEAGSPDEAYDIMGCQNSLQLVHSDFNSATGLINWIGDTRATGMPVSIGTWDSLPGGSGPVVHDHAYDVVKVNKDANGNYVSIELRNPWGKDGANDGSNPNDGYVTLTKAQLWAATEGVWTANA